MIVAAGTRLGPYEILSAIGAGGMGEVYRARDTKLGRAVAIKILPALFTSDPERRARFDREARMLAALNHPHIAQIFGFEDVDGTHALVMELVEGETVGERIEGLRAKGKGLTLDEALAIARQIADALEYAHEQGIIHRDLKPANIMVTPAGVVKVLDFGLAKAVAGDGSGVDLSQAPTVTGTGTRAGVVLGTPAYMSPEQARGKPVDKRTDIWAFGCVLFELLCGRAAFAGETTNDVVAKILERDPDWRALPAATPAGVRRLVQRCFEKDPNRRLHDIGDARVELDDALSSRQASAPLDRAGWRAGAWLIASTAAAVAVGLGLYAWRASSSRERSGTEVGQNQWVQLTRLPDAVSQPALSPDGRMLTFVRGPGTFYTPGQIYVKMLPDGEPKQLTHDNRLKMSPVFAPDGSRIAYTTVDDAGFTWDTWVVPVLSGEPRLWLPNASGLSWIQKRRLLFSEIKKNMHMTLVMAEENRTGAREVYAPPRENGMAHRSYVSPDGQWALVVEMDGPWLPCRLVPMDGKSAGRVVGPPRAICTSAAWSPDGTWMYLNSAAGGSFHIWRQRFPDGRLEQITSGPTEEEGIAMAADGRSFTTAVGLTQRSVLFRDSKGERQISSEGYAFQPKFTPDGKRLLYLILKGRSAQTDPVEIWAAELDSGRNEPLLPGLSLANGKAFDISSDGRLLVVAARDSEARQGLWLVPLDGQSPPRQIPNVEGGHDSGVYWREGEVFFYHKEGDSGFAYRVREDGTGLRKAIERPISQILAISPDGQWLVAYDGALTAYPMAGGASFRIFGLNLRLNWSWDERSLFIQVFSTASGGLTTAAGRTYVVPLPPGRTWPQIPEGGFRSADDIGKLPGVRVIESSDATPGLTPETYAFSRESMQRNLYRVPVP
jgi:Tol biopolymer transport system component